MMKTFKHLSDESVSGVNAAVGADPRVYMLNHLAANNYGSAFVVESSYGSRLQAHYGSAILFDNEAAKVSSFTSVASTALLAAAFGRQF